MHQRCERYPKRHTKEEEEESEALSETDGLCASEHGLRGLVLGGPVSVMEVSRPASKLKATSYYSLHPVICRLLM